MRLGVPLHGIRCTWENPDAADDLSYLRPCKCRNMIHATNGFSSAEG